MLPVLTLVTGIVPPPQSPNCQTTTVISGQFSHIAPPTQTSGTNTTICLWTRASNWTDPRWWLITAFENSMGRCFAYAKPMGFSRDICLYAVAEWLKLIFHTTVVRVCMQLLNGYSSSFTRQWGEFVCSCWMAKAHLSHDSGESLYAVAEWLTLIFHTTVVRVCMQLLNG